MATKYSKQENYEHYKPYSDNMSLWKKILIYIVVAGILYTIIYFTITGYYKTNPKPLVYPVVTHPSTVTPVK